MSEPVTFDVIGLPAPQGSKTAYVRGGRAVIVDGSSKSGREKHAQWRADVCDAAKLALLARGGEQFCGPVEVQIRFWMPLPASDQHRTLHSTTPDLDKLVRAVGDALVNAGLLKDDSLIWSMLAQKAYAQSAARVDGDWCGAQISISDCSALEAQYRVESKARSRARA